MKNPQIVSILPSGARTVTPTDQAMLRGRGSDGYSGIRVLVNVSALTASPDLVVTVQGYNPITDQWFSVLIGTAITDVTGTGQYVYKVFPGATPSAGATANDVLPGTWRVITTHGDADSITYSVTVELLQGA